MKVLYQFLFAAFLTGSFAAAHAADMSASQQTDANQPANKLDPSLIPGLQAQLKAAQDDAASERDTYLAAKKELDERRSERDRWNDQIAAVDKDKENFEKQYTEQQTEVAAGNSRCNPYPPDLESWCLAEKANLDAWQERLEQAKADLDTRYSDIEKMTKNLDERIGVLASEYINHVYKMNAALKRAGEISKQLDQQ